MNPLPANLDDDTEVEVTMKVDSWGIVSLGIRINGSNVLVLSANVAKPQPDCKLTYGTTIGKIMQAPPSDFDPQ
jgi:hypothetical protein